VKTEKYYAEIYPLDLENALLDYENYAEKAPGGRYRCRECGMLFDTLEEHDLHYRRMHGQIEAVSLAGMPL
jgi:hypothetical protein